jgi:hypothetical protein
MSIKLLGVQIRAFWVHSAFPSGAPSARPIIPGQAEEITAVSWPATQLARCSERDHWTICIGHVEIGAGPAEYRNLAEG